MPVVLWRIAQDTPDYVADDMSGAGAEAMGYRWNRVGTPLVYSSTSRALACLETIVHLARNKPLPLNRCLVQLTVPDDLWTERTIFDPAAHVGWDVEPIGMVSLDWGDAWATFATSALAEVPSVIVPEESNVLINPRHADAARVGAMKVRRWTYDARLRTNPR